MRKKLGFGEYIVTSCVPGRISTFWLPPLRKMKRWEIRLKTKIQFQEERKKEDRRLEKKEEVDVTRETKGKFGDESSGDGESNQEGPIPLPFSLEENRPWIEQSHFFFSFHPFLSSSPPPVPVRSAIPSPSNPMGPVRPNLFFIAL